MGDLGKDERTVLKYMYILEKEVVKM